MVDYGGKIQKGSAMNAIGASESMPGRMLSGEDLLSTGRSLKVLALLVILLLSAGIIVLGFQHWLESGLLGLVVRTDGQVVYGFALLMLLTVGYLVGKGWSTTRLQRTMISQLLEEESVSRARRLDPILEFHHPELAQEILLRQANYAGRIHSAISMVEMTVTDFGKLAHGEQTHSVIAGFYEEIRRLCRPLDFWVRWTPNSFLLLLLDVTPEETAGVVYRLRSQMQHWWEQQPDAASIPNVEWRYRTVGGLGASGDILREVRSLMEPAQFVPTPMPGVWQPKGEPTAAVALQLEGKGRTSL
jgi:hypothetical protein